MTCLSHEAVQPVKPSRERVSAAWRLESFEYRRPTDLDEALELLAEPGAMIYGGGTDLMVEWREDRRIPRLVVDIKGLDELRGLRFTDKGELRLGASLTITEIRAAGLHKGPYNMLADAARDFGCAEIRNRATVGGNIANAAPCSQLAPTLLVAQGWVEVASLRGCRTIPAQEIFLGVNHTSLQPGELITALVYPALPPEARSSCRCLHRGKGMDLASALVAMLAMDGQFRIALGSVAPTPIRVPQVEAILSAGPLAEVWEQAAESLRGSMSPRASSLRASPLVKQEAVVAMVREALDELKEGR